jgi:hypothetical protein
MASLVVVALAVGALAVIAFGATTTVRPSSMDGWAAQTDNPTAAVTFMNGPGSPPLGSGSAELKTGNGTIGGDGAAQLRNVNYAGTKLSDLTELRYSTYVIQNNGQQAPYLILQIDTDLNGTVDDLLFFEPPYQNPVDGNPSLPNQGSVALNTWQSWNALSGGWYSFTYAGPGTGVDSLAGYITANPNARIVNSTTGAGGVRLLVGFASANDQFKSNVDAFKIGVSGTTDTYDFEPDVPPPADKEGCKKGGWMASTNPKFKNQGDCVSYLSTGGRNPGSG